VAIARKKHLNQPIIKADIEARNPPTGSNGNQSIAQIPM